MTHWTGKRAESSAVSVCTCTVSRCSSRLGPSYHGVLAEITHAPSQFCELEIELDLPLVGQEIRGLSGRVVKVVQREGLTRIGVEFTAMSPEQRAAIQLFVQLLIQGTEAG